MKIQFIKCMLFSIVILVSHSGVSCPACFGKNNADDEAEILKMYKQKSEFYKQKYRTEFSPGVKQGECDFSKGNDNCKKATP